MTNVVVGAPAGTSTVERILVERTSVNLPVAVEGQDRDVPLYTGGMLGQRRVIERDDGVFLSLLHDAPNLAPQEEILRRCMPVAFFQEIMHRHRLGCVDERVYEQPGQPEGYPGVRLDVRTLNFKHNGMPLTHYARTQLCGHARVPVEFFHRIVEQGEVQLAALNINQCIKQRAAHIRGAERGVFLIRTQHGTVIAVLTDNYGIFDNHDLMDAFVQCFPVAMVPELMVSQFWSDGHDMEGTVIVPDEWTNEPGNVFGIGIAFKNSNIGKRSMNFRPFVTRNGRTGIMYDKKEITNGVMEVKHTSGISVASVKREIEQNVPALLRSANSLRTHLLNSREITIVNPRDVLATLAIRYGIPAVVSRQWYRNWVCYGMVPYDQANVTQAQLSTTEPEQNSVFHLLDSLMETALSQTQEAQISMQTMAGQMLIDGLDKTEEELTILWTGRIMPEGNRLRRSSTGPERIIDYTVGTPEPTGQTTREALLGEMTSRTRRRRAT